MPLELRPGRPPLPPDDLINRVVPFFGPENAADARRAFDEEAVTHLRLLERGLAVLGKEFGDFERLLDFGCGCGRFVRHLGPLAEGGTEVHGIDIDGEMIEWLRAHVPYGHFETGPHVPPTPYEDGFFDLVLNHSVFTHLDEHFQDLWLTELQRIVRPGGVLLLTVQSLQTWNTALRDFAGGGEDPERYRAPLETNGILFIEHDTYVGSTHPDFYHTTFHAPWYVFEHWTRFFELRAYLPQGSHSQDLVVLERRPEGVEAPPPIGHRSRVADAAPAPDAPPPGPAVEVDELVRRVERLDSLVASRPPPVTLLGRARQRVLGPELSRRDEIDAEVVALLRELSSTLTEVMSSQQAALRDLGGRLDEDTAGRQRELLMLRQALYEQGRRVSLVASQLRDELAERLGAGE